MIKAAVKNVLSKNGYIKVNSHKNLCDMDKKFIDIYSECKDYTLTSIERMYALFEAVNYILKHDIPGDFVECGVWKGGSVMLIAKMLLEHSVDSRKIYLYDTFEGMVQPTDKDINHANITAKEKWDDKKTGSNSSAWCFSPIDEVKNNVFGTGYHENNFVFVKGMVEDTIPITMPETISLLRLDTDFYESTYHELTYLYPLLIQGGILIIDDYGHWRGSREATDQYINENGLKLYLNRVDYAGRVALKI